MDPNPTVLVAQQPATGNKFSLKIKLLIILAVIVAALYLIWYLIINNFAFKPTKITNSSSVLQSVKTSFSAPQYKNIIGLTNLIAQTNDPNKKYQYYVILFQKISSFYQQSKDPKILLILSQLKDYAAGFAQYQKADFAIKK